MEGAGDGPGENPPDHANVKEACEQLRCPEPLVCTTETFKQVWKNWKEEVTLYMELAHGNKKPSY